MGAGEAVVAGAVVDATFAADLLPWQSRVVPVPSRREIGFWPLTHAANSAFCMVDVDVVNRGPKGVIVWPPSQRLIDADKRGHTPDTRSLLYYTDTQSTTRRPAPSSANSSSTRRR
ncbi:DUF4352 domain-containing protein [Micromonospora sp. HNM0581]|nr:DUF4352 domain-containing protein [Micromonospora sp. HNM0581]